MSESKDFIKPADPPPYEDPSPTIAVTSQPQMSVGYSGGVAMVGQPGMMTGQGIGMIGQPGMMTGQGIGMVGQPGMMTGQGVGMVGQPGTMTAVAPGFIVLNQMVYQPTPFECKSCHQQIVTKVKRKATFKTHFFAAGFCFVCLIPCAIIPYCIDGCKQCDHYCPNCDSFIGSYIP